MVVSSSSHSAIMELLVEGARVQRNRKRTPRDGSGRSTAIASVLYEHGRVERDKEG